MRLNKKLKLTNIFIAACMSVFMLQANASVAVSEKTSISVVDNADIAQIEALMTSYQHILNDAEVDKVKDVYTNDAQFIGQGFPTMIGVNDIFALYSDFLSKLDFNVKFEIIDISLTENLGFIQTISKGTITPKEAKAGNDEANREIFVVKKENNEWKINRYIFTAELK